MHYIVELDGYLNAQPWIEHSYFYKSITDGMFRHYSFKQL